MIAETSTIADTIAGAETIEMQEGSPTAVLLLHGFGDTPQTLGHLAKYLHGAGYDVRAPLLPGHGRSVQAFLKSRREEWLTCARDEYARLRATYETVSIAGLSMGGALAAIVASENEDVASLVLISPYLEMPAPHRIAAVLHPLWNGFAGARKSSSPGSILDPEERAKNLGYGVYSGRLLYELWRLAESARRALSGIRAPTLLIQSRRDPRIAPEVAERAIARVGATEKKLVWESDGGHIITVDYGRDRVLEGVESWISAHTVVER
jgi:carboxylesterase